MTDDHDHDRHDRLDTSADAIALYRAVLDGDDEGRDTIIRHTGCLRCLTVNVVKSGILLRALAGDDYLSAFDAASTRAAGRMVYSAGFRSELVELLAGVQRELA